MVSSILTHTAISSQGRKADQSERQKLRLFRALTFYYYIDIFIKLLNY